MIADRVTVSIALIYIVIGVFTDAVKNYTEGNMFLCVVSALCSLFWAVAAVQFIFNGLVFDKREVKIRQVS